MAGVAATLFETEKRSVTICCGFIGRLWRGSSVYRWNRAIIYQ
jgi:hypothetical protein